MRGPPPWRSPSPPAGTGRPGESPPLALRTWPGLSTATRSRNFTPSRAERVSHTRMGFPHRAGPGHRGGGGLLPRQRGGSHLTAGHAIRGIVDKDGGELLATIGGVNDLRCANGCKVAVALVCKDHLVRLHPLDARGHCRSPAMQRADGVRGHEPGKISTAAHTAHADRVPADAQLVNHRRHQLHNDPMVQPGQNVKGLSFRDLGFSYRTLMPGPPSIPALPSR